MLKRILTISVKSLLIISCLAYGITVGSIVGLSDGWELWYDPDLWIKAFRDAFVILPKIIVELFGSN